MSTQHLLLVLGLLMVLNRLTESKRTSRYSVERLFKTGLKSIGKDTGENENDDDDTGDSEDNDENDSDNDDNDSDTSDDVSEDNDENDSDYDDNDSDVPPIKNKTNSGALSQSKASGYRPAPAPLATKNLTQGDQTTNKNPLGQKNTSKEHVSTHQTMPQTTSTPYPDAYQGYSPVTVNNTKSLHTKTSVSSKPSGTLTKSKRSRKLTRRHSFNSDRNTRWRHVPKHSSHRRKYKKLQNRNNASLSKLNHYRNGSQTKGLQMTVLKTTNCSRTGSVEADILKSVWTLQNMMYKLNAKVDKGVHKLGNQGTDNTNEERADIKSNSNRISQLQQGLSGKIDDLRYNITGLMMSQKELGRSVNGALEDMMDLLKQMVSMVTGSDAKLQQSDNKIKRLLMNKSKSQTTANTTQETPVLTENVLVKNVNRNSSAMNATQNTPQPKTESGNRSKDESSTQKNKGSLNSQKRLRKKQKLRKLKRKILSGRLGRRSGYLKSNKTRFHNDHSIVNRFKNNDYFTPRQRLDPFNGQSFYSTDRLRLNQPKANKDKGKNGHHNQTENLHTIKRYSGRKVRGQRRLINDHKTPEHKRKLQKTRATSNSKSEKSRSTSEEDIDKELERLLKQELNELKRKY